MYFKFENKIVKLLSYMRPLLRIFGQALSGIN